MSDFAEEVIRETGIIAIVRGAYTVEELVAIADALSEGGVRVLEVTLNTSSALKGIGRLQQHARDRMVIGAGTVRTADDVNAAIDAGAQFLVAPNFDQASVARAKERDVLHLPGVATPTEVQNAFVAGCQMQKFFPAGEFGPSYLRALRGPLEDIDFVPTGGIDAEAISPFVEAGAVAFGVGSALVTGPDQSEDDLEQRASRLLGAFESAIDG